MSPRSDAVAVVNPQRVTPTGVVVTDAQPESDEWFAARRQGITATDIPKILGESDYGNAVSVWMDKRGEWVEEVGEEADWGRELEPVIAKVWSQRNDTSTAPIEVVCHADRPWMIASLDRQVSYCPTGEAADRWGCGLEIKTRNAFVAGNWRDDMPDDVLAQVAWQRMVSGYGHIHVACLIGGQRLIEHVYRRDADLEALLLAEASRVWGHVQDGTRPLADPNALLTRVLDVLYANRDGVLELDADGCDAVLAAIDDYEVARRMESLGKTGREAAKARLVEILADREACLIEGRLAYSYRPNINGVRSLKIAADIRKAATQ